MDQAEFLRVLKQGRGRAMLMLRDHGAEACREGLLHACLHDLTADLGLSDFRAKPADYLMELVLATGEPEVYRDAVLEALSGASYGGPRADACGSDGDAGSEVDGDDAYQWMGLVRRFAQRGDAEARRVLYAQFHAQADVEELACGGDLVALDGLAGFLVAAERLRRAGPTDRDAWRFWAWVQELGEQLGEAEAWRALDEAAAEHEWLAQMLAVERDRQQARKKPDPGWKIGTFEELSERIVSGTGVLGPQVMRWGREASREDLQRAADALLDSTGDRERALWLAAFEERRFPGDIDRLLPLAQDRDCKVREAALRALGNVKDGRVRGLLLQMSDDPNWAAAAVGLLRANLEPGDESVVEDRLRRCEDLGVLHSAELRLRDVVEANPTALLDGALVVLLERGVCSMCRHSAAALLQKRGALPAWFLEEAAWDANPDVRAMVGGGGKDDVAGLA